MNQWCFSELAIGMSAEFSIEVTGEMQAAFCRLSGDVNPLHTSQEEAVSRGFPQPVVYGMLTASFYSTLVGVYLPGRYCLFQELQVAFCSPVFVKDVLHISGKIVERNETFKRVKIKAEIRNQENKKVSRAIINAGVSQ